MSKGDDILGAEVDLSILSTYALQPFRPRRRALATMADLPGIATVVRTEGRNLIAKDGSGFLKLGKASTSDPYIKVTLTGAKSDDPPLATTEVVSKNLNPEWNQTCI